MRDLTTTPIPDAAPIPHPSTLFTGEPTTHGPTNAKGGIIPSPQDMLGPFSSQAALASFVAVPAATPAWAG